jgi:TonB-dependent SusC/RagA subfamily outer membrane receptor
MSSSGPGALAWRVGLSVAGGLMMAALAACHHRSAPVAQLPAPERVQLGYTQPSEDETGGAVPSLDTAAVRGRPTSQVEQLLIGRFPGVEVLRTPTGGFAVRIRGRTTLLGNAQPLYVVDGIPVEVTPERGLDWLSPWEIERIDILKTPAETSLYGVRGANGVIVITTKRPD